MPNTIATRIRPFTSPHPISTIQADAIANRDKLFAERKAAIARMMELSDDPEPREFDFAMTYDLEQAPLITARARLLEAGIIPVPPQELADPTSLHDELWTIIEALSLVGIYLMNTGHLTDSDLYARLYYRILDEETRLMPPAAEAAEYIDCLHPMDLHHPLGKMLADRCGKMPNPTNRPYIRGPKFTMPYTINTRDEHLPRPSFD
jgi:hypothetical protein